MDQSAPGGGRRRRTGRYILLVVILLLLALLASCSVSMAIVSRVGPQQARFVATNAGCLVCHTDLLAEMLLPSTHQPFVQRNCTSCHLPHASLVKVTVTSGESSGTVTAATWFRWGPFRRPYDAVQRALFGVSKATQRTWQREALGDAALVAPEDRLCWLCHGNLSGQKADDYQHQPFAANHCLSCHDPHASRFKPLLTERPEILCLTCHPIGPELNRTYVHQPVIRRECLLCHNAHASDYAGILVANQRDLCFTCHPSVASQSTQPVQHEPFVDDDCTGCHEPHGADVAPLLVESTPGLCYNCHTSIEPRFSRVSHHPVPSQINCQSCHQPHASNYSALLLTSERQLCLSCHTDIAQMTTLAVQHAPFDTEPCTSCHVPHGSPYPPLLVNPQPNLCYICHPQLADAMNKTSHHPDQCSRCHTVHASEYLRLLVAPAGNSFCYRCHPQIRAGFVQSFHSPMACRECHRPHGSRYEALLNKSGPKLCTECHTPVEAFVGDGDWTHRASTRFLDNHSKKPLTCTSTCHDPHTVNAAHITKNFPSTWDGVCLQCHPGVGKQF